MSDSEWTEVSSNVSEDSWVDLVRRWVDVAGGESKTTAALPRRPRTTTKKRSIQPKVEDWVEEPDLMTSKEAACLHRSHRFARVGGHTVWKRSWKEPVGTRLYKEVRANSTSLSTRWKGYSELELRIGATIPNNMDGLSLDKNKLWATVPEVLNELSDFVKDYAVGHQAPAYSCHKPGSAAGAGDAERTVYALFDPNVYQKRTDKSMTGVLHKIVYDRFARRELLRRKCVAEGLYLSGRQRRTMRLKSLSDIPKSFADYARLKPTLSASSTNPARQHSGGCRGGKVKSAHTYLGGERCYWSPRQICDARDYIELDLQTETIVAGISTRGRPLCRDDEDLVMPSPEQWVTSYKLYHRANTQTAWVLVGEFQANTDSESEVAHTLLDPHTNQPGLRTRFLRLKPTGAHGRKALRVGVYGTKRSNEEQPNRATTLLDEVVSQSKPALVFKVCERGSYESRGKHAFSLSICSCPGCSNSWRKCEGARSFRQRAHQREVQEGLRQYKSEGG